MDFKRLGTPELDGLTDEKLIAYTVAARDAGENDAARRALGVLVFRRYDDVLGRVRTKLRNELADDAEDVAMESISSALKASFAGVSVGQFVNLLHTITDRRVADYFEKRKRRLKTKPIPEENIGDEEVWGDGPTDEGFAEEIDTRAVLDQALGELSAPHRAVVEEYLTGASAKEAAQALNESMGQDLDSGMTDANVHQITKRFRDRMRELLEEARGSG